MSSPEQVQPEQAQMIESIRSFTARAIAPAAARVDESCALPDGLWQALGEQGLTGLIVPARWGGIGAETSTFLAAVELLAGACGSTVWAFLAHCAAEQAILALGTDEQRDRWLPGLAAGKIVGAAVASTETGGGSNPLSTRLSARPDGDGWVLDGSKHFITLAGAADLHVVTARTSDAPAPTSISCFLVAKSDPGVSFGKREETTGVRGVPIAELHLDNCRLTGDRLLGAQGSLMALFGAIGKVALLGTGAASLGLAQASLDAATAYVKERKVLGQPLAAQPGVQAIVGDAYFELAGARAWLAQATAWFAQGAGGMPIPAWMAKIAVTEAALHVIERSLSLHGLAGFTRGLSLERNLRDARALCIHWGNNDVLRNSLRQLSVA